MNNEPKIYIASKTKHADKWIALRASGVNIISTWIDEAGAGETVSMELLAAQCIYQSKECDAMIVYREFDDYLKGAFIEMGIAITYPLKPIVLVGPVLPPGSVFTHLPNVFAADSIDEAIAAIRKNHRPLPPPTKEAERGLTIHHTDGTVLSNQAADRAKELEDIYTEWTKSTNRNGGVLIGSSIHEFIKFASEKLSAKGHQEASTGQAGTTAEDDWVRVEDKPLITFIEENKWISTVEVGTYFLAAVPNHDKRDGKDHWWVRLCVIEEIGGMRVVGEDDNEPAGWEAEDVTHYRIVHNPKQSPTPTTDKVEEQLREHAATWEEAVAHTKEDNSAMSKTAYLEQLENKLRKQ